MRGRPPISRVCVAVDGKCDKTEESQTCRVRSVVVERWTTIEFRAVRQAGVTRVSLDRHLNPARQSFILLRQHPPSELR